MGTFEVHFFKTKKFDLGQNGGARVMDPFCWCKIFEEAIEAKTFIMLKNLALFSLLLISVYVPKTEANIPGKSISFLSISTQQTH